MSRFLYPYMHRCLEQHDDKRSKPRVDALCIIQDDLEDNTAQTRRMDQVYGLAEFTIIAACGKTCT